MEKVKILCLNQLSDNFTKSLIVVLDESVFGTDVYKQKLDDLFATIFDIANETDEDILEEYQVALENVVNGKDGYYLDYELLYETCEVA